MRAGGIFFKLEVKKYVGAVPGIFLESLLFGLLILIFGAFASKYMYGTQSIGKIRVGVVSMEDEKLSGMLTDFAATMDSMRESCSFEIMDEDTAYRRLKEGSIYAAVIIPEGMVDGIMNGQNIPATVLFGTAAGRIETEVFREFADAGGRLLGTAQAGIYAADELCIDTGNKEWIRETEDYLNKTYLQYALGRDTVFHLNEVQATGDYSLVQYYSAALLLSFLSFAGLMLLRLSRNRQTVFSRTVGARGFGVMGQTFADILAFVAVFTLSGMIFCVFCLQLTAQKTGFSVLSVTALSGLFAVLFCMGLFLRLLVLITGNRTAGLGVSFVILLGMMIASGLFLPSSFLPKAVEKAGNYFPYRLWLEIVLKSMG